MEDFYETPVEDAKQFGDLAIQAVEQGYTAFKSMAVPPTAPLEGLRPIQRAEAAPYAVGEHEAARDGRETPRPRGERTPPSSAARLATFEPELLSLRRQFL